jgi:hypothetical protein
MTKTRQIVLGFSDLLKLFPCKDGKKKDNQKKTKNKPEIRYDTQLKHQI